MRKIPTTKEILVEIYARKESDPPHPLTKNILATAIGSAIQDGNGGTAFSGHLLDDNAKYAGPLNMIFSDSFVLSVGRQPKKIEYYFSRYLKGRIAIARKGEFSSEVALNGANLSKSSFDYAKKAIKPYVNESGGWFVSTQPNGKIIAGIFLVNHSSGTESGEAYVLIDGEKSAKYNPNVTVTEWIKPSKI